VELDEERLMDFPSVFRRFIAMEPPLVVGLFFVLVINSSVGLFWVRRYTFKRVVENML
jgi:hypothetical protein